MHFLHYDGSIDADVLDFYKNYFNCVYLSVAG